MISHCIQVNSPLLGRSEIACYKIVELAFHTITATLPPLPHIYLIAYELEEVFALIFGSRDPGSKSKLSHVIILIKNSSILHSFENKIS